MVKKFKSQNRSTQLVKQLSSDRSRVDCLMLLETHFFQQSSVTWCVSVACCVSWRKGAARGWED